ncbi:MAG: hypothetical protein Q9161_006514 [Pseudevernia consocians]
MSFLFRGKMAKSPATYLFKGFFPNLSRHLSGPRHTTKQLTRVTSPQISTKAQGVAVPDGGSTKEEVLPKEGTTDATVDKGHLAEQLCAARFISPHPLVTFADVPAVCGVQSNYVLAYDVFDPQRPLFLGETVSPSLKFAEIETKSSSTEGSFNKLAQAVSTPRQSADVEPESSSAEGSLDPPARPLDTELSTGFDSQSRKHLNRRSLPTFPLSHSRDVSSSSNDTVVWSPSSSSSTSSPVTSEFGQMLQDAYRKIIGEKLIDKVHGLEGTIEELRLRVSDQTERAAGLETDLEICERDRQLNFNTALRLYRNSGNLFSLERENLMDQVNRLRFEVWDRDSQIWSRDQLIQALRLDLTMYASHEQWLFLRQCFYALQQKYGQMPEEFRTLEKKYEDLEEMHIDVSDRFRKLEGDHTELKVQLDQNGDERNRLEDAAETFKQSSAEAAARYRVLKVQRDQIIGQKAESERKARANEQLLAGLAARMFKRILCMADVNSMDEEQIALCQLAKKHLGLDATKISNNFEKAGASGDREIEEERDESNIPESLASEASPSMSTSKYNSYELTVPNGGVNDGSIFTVTGGRDVLESPDTFEARRRREVAAAEEEILGPLGLGFKDGSPTLKTIPKSSKSTKVSRFMSLFPKSPDTPSKISGVLSTAGADYIDQITPARTGGTGGIARDQWKVAGNDLHEFTEVFRGPRAQPIEIVSPGVGTQGAEDGSQRIEENPSQVFEEGAISSTSEDAPHDEGPVDGMGVGSDLENDIDGPVLEGDNGETSRSEYEGRDHQNPFSPLPTAAPKPASSAESASLKSFSEKPVGSGSPIFPDLGVGNEAVKEEANNFVGLPKEAFNAPRLQDFRFGGNSDGVPFFGSENESLTPSIPASEPASTGLFNLSSTSLAQAPGNAYDPSRFEQDFNFGGSNGPVLFTASSNTSSSLPARTPEVGSASASSALGASLAQNQAEENAPKEGIPENDTIKNEGTEKDVSDPNMPNKKKAMEEARKKEEEARKEKPKFEGPNRNQRRAASRERKAAEKKAQAAVVHATQRGRKAVERAMMRG